MDELINRVAGAAGLAPDTARTAIGVILRFLHKEAGPEALDPLIAAVPGSRAVIEDPDARQQSGAGLMGSLGSMVGGGGGIMGLGTQLMGAGLSMPQIQTVGRELFAYGRETAGEDAMGGIVAAVPGLSQFV